MLYPPTLPTEDVDELAGYVSSPDGRGVLAGPHPDAQAISATNAEETLTCENLQVDQLTKFTPTWLESIGG